MEPIQVPEHVLTEAEMTQLSWKLGWKAMLIITILLCAFIWAIVAAWGLGFLGLPITLIAVPGSLLSYRYSVIPNDLRSPKVRNIYRKRSYELSPTGVSIWSEEGLHGFTPWSFFISGLILDSHVLLYFSQTNYYLIPRRVLSPESNKQIERLVTSHITPVKMG